MIVIAYRAYRPNTPQRKVTQLTEIGPMPKPEYWSLLRENVGG